MKKVQPTKKWALPLGIIVIIFAVVGLIFVIKAAVTGIVGLFDTKTDQMKKYQTMLVPVVMNDIDEFDDITKANMGQLIEASIWSIIKSDVSTDEYETDADKIMIPQADVDKAFSKLFGTAVSPAHQSVYSSAFEMEYDSGKQVYKVPITGVDATYTPRVLEIDEKSNTLVLTVAYLSGSEWSQSDSGELVAPEPSKYVKVTLRQKDKAYYISAIQATDPPEAVTEK